MSCYDRRCDSAGSGGITYRKFGAELFGTALLVFFGCGVATLMFGFGFDGGSVAAGVVATALAFGLVLLSLAYVLGPVSGCHVNPAVTVGALLAGRIPLWGMFSTSPMYSKSKIGLGADGFGAKSMIHINVG